MKITVFFHEGTGDVFETRDLSYVVLDGVSVDDSLGGLAALAERRRGIDSRGRNIFFVSLPDEAGNRQVRHALSWFVREGGVLRWIERPLRYEDVTVADLERSHEEELFPEDPHAIVLDWQPIGEPELLVPFDDLIRFLKDLGAIGSGVWIIGSILRAVRRGIGQRKGNEHKRDAAWLAGFIQRHRDHWEREGAESTRLLAFVLGRKAWDSAQLRRLLEIPPDEAHRFLEICGYDYEPGGGLYRLSVSKDRRRLREELVERIMGWDASSWEQGLEGSGSEEGPED